MATVDQLGRDVAHLDENYCNGMVLQCYDPEIRQYFGNGTAMTKRTFGILGK